MTGPADLFCATSQHKAKRFFQSVKTNVNHSYASYIQFFNATQTQPHFMNKPFLQSVTRRFISIMLLSLPFTALAFFGTDTDRKYEGQWVSLDKKEAIQITKNEKSYLVSSFSKPGEKLVGKLGSDGVLTIGGQLGRIDFVFESKTGDLIGGGKTFKRANPAPKMTEEERRRWITSLRFPNAVAVFGTVGIDILTQRNGQLPTWQPEKNRWKVSPAYLDRLKKWQSADFVTISEIPKVKNLADIEYSSIHQITPTAKLLDLYKGKLIDDSGKLIAQLPAIGQLAWVPVIAAKYLVFESVARTTDDGMQSVLILFSQEKATNALFDAVSQTPFVPGQVAYVEKLVWDVRTDEWVRKDMKQLIPGTKAEMKQQDTYKSMWRAGDF